MLQLPRRSSDGWNAAARAYWSHFGDLIGAATPAISVPVELHGVETRAVAVKPQLAARIGAEDMDVVTETADNTAGTGFDLVVALHALATFDRIEQTLAFASIAQMMNAGGLFLADAPVSAVILELRRWMEAYLAYCRKRIDPQTVDNVVAKVVNST